MGKPVEVRVLSRAVLDPATYLEAKTIGKLRIPVILVRYLRPAAFRRAGPRALINCDSLFRSAAVRSPFFAEGAAFVPAVFLLASQAGLMDSQSFLRPTRVSAPFFLVAVGF